MAELKIKADSGGGTVSLKGPATTTSNAAVQLTLPVDDGAANQYLKTDGSGALSWATVSTPVTALNNATANELVTVGSTTTELDGEANLTFDGNDLTLGDGNLVVASGHGINFSSTADSGGTMENELFDDYEEGTWDPVLYSTGGGDDFGYSQRQGFYTKIGRMVHYYMNMQWTKGSGVSAGIIQCKGFPFTTKNTLGGYYYIGSNMELGGLDGDRPFVLVNANGNNVVSHYNTGGATGLTGFAYVEDVGSSGSSWFSLTVFVSV